MFIYLASEKKSSPSLESTTSQAQINNMFINKLVSTRLDFNKYNIICLYVYLCKNILIL